jgi:BclA C-terminal domain
MLVSCGRDRARLLPLRLGFIVTPLILVCFAVLPQMRADPTDILRRMTASPHTPDVSPPPDGVYSGSTAEGYQALFSLTTGGFDTALGWRSLYIDTTASFNTGVGAGTLALNNGDENTATGAGALLLNTSGEANTADGALALIFNSTGSDNSAFGDRALEHTTGSNNIALGSSAGFNLTSGDNNIDIGNEGVAGESGIIRIGDQALHDSVFLAGIGPMSPEPPTQVVVVDPGTGQLGSALASSLPPTGLPTVLFDYNTGAVTIGVGGAVPFNQGALIIGTAISETNNTTYTINELGLYRVSYTLRTALASLLANVQVRVNGAGTGPTAALAVAGTSLSDQVTFIANTGDMVQLVVGGVALTLGTGDNATINIDKLR